MTNCVLVFRRHRHKSDSMSNDSRKQVLVLGAGMVCAPLVEYLYRDERISINVCSQFKEEADGIANRFPGKDRCLHSSFSSLQPISNIRNQMHSHFQQQFH